MRLEQHSPCNDSDDEKAAQDARDDHLRAALIPLGRRSMPKPGLREFSRLGQGGPRFGCGLILGDRLLRTWVFSQFIPSLSLSFSFGPMPFVLRNSVEAIDK